MPYAVPSHSKPARAGRRDGRLGRGGYTVEPRVNSAPTTLACVPAAWAVAIQPSLSLLLHDGTAPELTGNPTTDGVQAAGEDGLVRTRGPTEGAAAKGARNHAPRVARPRHHPPRSVADTVTLVCAAAATHAAAAAAAARRRARGRLALPPLTALHAVDRLSFGETAAAAHGRRTNACRVLELNKATHTRHRLGATSTSTKRRVKEKAH
jgi:hypothetical protein